MKHRFFLLLYIAIVLSSCDDIASVVSIDDSHCVDMGLSINWSGYNLGAKSPCRLGNTYPWGSVHSDIPDNSLNLKPNTTYKDISGDSKFDPARKYWGEGWRTPTKEDWEELIRRCRWRRYTYQGVEGYKVTGPNGKAIFFPGRVVNDEIFETRYTDYGYYWSSTSSETKEMIGLPQVRIDEYGSAHEIPAKQDFISAYCIDLRFVNFSNQCMKKELKINCFYIRPVCDKEQ